MSIISKLLDLFNLEKRNTNEYNIKDINEPFEDCVSSITEITENHLESKNNICENDLTNSTINSLKSHESIQISTEEYNDNIETEQMYMYTSIENEEPQKPYFSNRFSIKGLDLFFIPIAREIVKSNTISQIPLMREYNIDSTKLNEILNDMRIAQIIDENSNILMTSEEFEKFIDIYEPSLFECKHSVFDKDIFMCMGEIMYDKGIEDTYKCLSPDEIIDYLNIMEKLNIVKYNHSKNIFTIEVTKDNFLNICTRIPNHYSKSKNTDVKEYDKMSGTEFENFCAQLLIKNGFGNVQLTSSTGDHGIDIFAEKDEITYAVQCKCYSSNVGNSAVQQIYTGKCFFKKDIGVILTNRYFTPQAISEASELGIKLWNRDKLELLINN